MDSHRSHSSAVTLLQNRPHFSALRLQSDTVPYAMFLFSRTSSGTAAGFLGAADILYRHDHNNIIPLFICLKRTIKICNTDD